MKMFIEMEIKSQNERDSWHWSKRGFEKKAWVEHVFAALKGRTAKHHHQDKKKIVLICSHRKRRIDKENLIGGAKGLIDSLKVLELIKDDSPKWVEIHFEQILQKPNGTLIEIMDAE